MVILFFFILKLNVFDERKSVVVLISVDGLAHNYLSNPAFDKFIPTIKAFANNATLNMILRPSFPSSTFPNQYTAVTGLYPSYHGIISDEFYNPETGSDFRAETRVNPNWWRGNPIWSTVQQQGLKSASIFCMQFYLVFFQKHSDRL